MAVKTLKGRTALITGAGKRIGRSIALALSEEGANIVVHYRSSKKEAEDLSNEVKAKGVRSWTIGADLGNPEEYGTLTAGAKEASGGIDILVNNASFFLPGTLEDVTFEDLMENIKVNAWVPFALSRDFSKLVKKGDIINILDTRIKGFDWNHVAYILSKHVLNVLTQMTAVQYAPGIRVNAVSPGLILPPPGKDESYLERLSGTNPLKRHGDPEDIASAVVYLLKNDFLTGTVIPVDGGRHLKEYPDGPNPY